MKNFESMKDWLIKKSKETSGREVARLTGIHHSNISKICNGEITSPRLDTMKKIEAAMVTFPLKDDDPSDKRFIIIASDGNSLSMKTNMESPEKCIAIMTNTLCGFVQDKGYSSELLIDHIKNVFARLEEFRNIQNGKHSILDGLKEERG